MTQITEKDSDVRRRIQVALDHGAHAIDADDVRELLATAHHDCPDCGGSGIVGTLPADGGAVHYEPCTRCGGLGSIVRIHTNATGNNFAWAEMDEAKAVIASVKVGA